MSAPRPRSVPLAERKAEARALDDWLKRHRREGCATCPDCEGKPAELARMRREIRAWHAPGPDDVPLFDLSGLQP